MFERRARRARAKCLHESTVSVRTAGIERVVCEKCGHLSFSITEDLLETPTRTQFERPTERPRTMVH